MEDIKKLVKRIGNSGHVTLPKSWLGNFVKVTLLEEEKDDKKNRKQL